MACYHYIKLPNGGEVRIPADSIIITEQDGNIYKKITTEINKFYSENKEFTTDSDLYSIIKESGINLMFNELSSIIFRSNANTLLDNINDKIIKKQGKLNLLDALRKNILFKDETIDYRDSLSDNYSKLPLNNFLEKLNEPLNKNYLDYIETKGLIGVNNLYDVLKDIDIEKGIYEDSGLSYEGLDTLRNLLTSIYWKNNRGEKLFYELDFNNNTNDAVVVKSETNNVIFYNGLNDISLIVGIFKSLASNIESKDLIEVLEDYNSKFKNKSENLVDLTNFDSVKFFIGEFITDENENTVFVEPEVNKILKTKSRKTISDIIDLFLPFIETSNGSKIKAGLLDLLSFMDKNKISEGINILENQELSRFNSEILANRDWTNTMRTKDIIPLIDSDKRNYHYSKNKDSRELFNNEDIYNYVLNNVNLNEDLLLVDIEDRTKKVSSRYIIPTSIKLTDRGVMVRGFYSYNNKIYKIYNGIVSTRSIKIKSKEIKPENVVRYKKLENINTVINTVNADPLSPDESIVILANKDSYLPDQLVKDSIVRGSSVSFKKSSTKKGKVYESEITKTVKGVYPGIVFGNSEMFKGKRFEPEIDTSKLHRIITHRSLFEDEFTDEDLSTKKQILSKYKNTKINKSYIPVGKGDYISYSEKGVNRYNKVVSVDKDNIYILIKTEDKYFVKSIDKKSITRLYKKEEDFQINEILNVAEVHDKVLKDYSINEYNYSIFENYEQSKNGDFIVVRVDNDNFNIFKITNKENREVIGYKIRSGKYSDYEYLKLPEDLGDFKILTTRNIFSPEGKSTAEMNNVFITTDEGLKLNNNEQLTEIKYLIPEDTNVEELTYLNSGNLAKGMFIFTNNDIPEGYKDVTDELISLINKERNIQGQKLYIKQKGNYYIRYNANLYQTDYSEDKNIKRKYLFSNAFIVLKDENNPLKSGRKMYRIISNSDNKLYLEYNSLNDNNKLISIYRTLDLETEEDKIKWLYIMKGNRAINELQNLKNSKELKPKNKNLSEIETDRKNMLHSVANRFKSLFNISVEFENNTELKNKKARILSTNEGSKILLNLNNPNMNKSDLLHEYLHLFLIALKYDTITSSSVNNYENLLLSYKETMSNKIYSSKEKESRLDIIKNTDDLSVLEEFFVEDITELMENENFIELEEFDHSSFANAFNSSLEALQIDNFKIDDSSIFSILSSKMSDIFSTVKSDIFDSSLIFFESNFRDWLSNEIKNNRIQVKCQ